MSNVQSKMCQSNRWKSLYKLNLSSSNDPHFKLFQIFEVDETNLLIDIRETLKGKKTKNGIILLSDEFQWFKNTLINDDSKIYKLEHNNRTIKIDKSNPEYLITLIKADGTINELLISSFEINILKKELNAIENYLKTRAQEISLNLNIKQDSYFNETIE